MKRLTELGLVALCMLASDRLSIDSSIVSVESPTIPVQIASATNYSFPFELHVDVYKNNTSEEYRVNYFYASTPTAEITPALQSEMDAARAQQLTDNFQLAYGGNILIKNDDDLLTKREQINLIVKTNPFDAYALDRILYAIYFSPGE